MPPKCALIFAGRDRPPLADTHRYEFLPQSHAVDGPAVFVVLGQAGGFEDAVGMRRSQFLQSNAGEARTYAAGRNEAAQKLPRGMSLNCPPRKTGAPPLQIWSFEQHARRAEIQPTFFGLLLPHLSDMPTNRQHGSVNAMRQGGVIIEGERSGTAIFRLKAKTRSTRCGDLCSTFPVQQIRSNARNRLVYSSRTIKRFNSVFFPQSVSIRARHYIHYAQK